MVDFYYEISMDFYLYEYTPIFYTQSFASLYDLEITFDYLAGMAIRLTEKPDDGAFKSIIIRKVIRDDGKDSTKVNTYRFKDGKRYKEEYI